MLDALHHFIVTAVGDYGYAAVFVLMALESACVPIPSEVTMLFGGALASAGFAAEGQQLSLFWVGMAGTLGNLVGSWLAYWAGAVGGRPLVDRWGRYLLIRPHEIDKAHDWFERYGDAAVFFSRLLPVIRTFISVPAGVVRMPFWRFTLYTILGCLPWTFALAWLGYMLGDRWESVERALQPFSWAIALACVVAVLWYVRRRWTTVRAEYAAIDAASNADEAALPE
jgi:membrane protein DedA with SNARE-associated domain